MVTTPTAPSKTPEKPKPQTKAGLAFASWVAERRKLTNEEILDIKTEILGLKEGVAPLDLKPKTEYGIAFVQWVLDQGVLTQKDLLDLETQIQAPKPVVPPPEPPPPEKPPEKPPPGKPTPPKPPRTNLLPIFLGWVKNQSPLFQLDQLIILFASWQKMTPEEVRILREQISKLPPEKQPPKKPPEKPPPEKPPEQPTEKPELIIERTPYPKWWKDARAWNIDIDVAGTHTVIKQTPGWRSYISTIVLTVDGETNITFGMGAFGDSGSMDLGGTDEPRGMVVAMGNSPMPLGGGGFTITSTGEGIHVGGFISYFYEKE
jgi:hypothetical protein